MQKLGNEKHEEQQNRRNEVSSFKPKQNKEYFENAGHSMPYGDLEEHGSHR